MGQSSISELLILSNTKYSDLGITRLTSQLYSMVTWRDFVVSKLKYLKNKANQINSC
jgi:hypothetical protein